MSVVRLYIESDSVPQVLVTPTWTGKIEQERPDDEAYFRDKIGGDFRFTGADYATLIGMPDCERVEIWLEEFCDGTWGERWRGHFTTYDLKNNENECSATVAPYLVDRYECFVLAMDTEINFSEVERTIVYSIQGLYQGGIQCCTDLILISEPTPTDPVCAVPANYCFDKNTRTPLWTPGNDLITSCFHRVRGVGISDVIPPPYGSGWTYLGLFLGVHRWWRCPVAGELELGKLGRGRLLNTVLEYMLTETGCALTLRSHFFGINATHTAPPSNIAYDYATDYLQYITLHQKSDVKRPDASNPAQDIVFKMKWRQLLEDLKTMFNVYWMITPDGELILEHDSYFNANSGLDISTRNIVVDYGKREETAPEKEVFIWADDAAFSAPHKGEPINYGECGDGIKERKVNLFSNDIFYIRTVENQSEISDTGYCLVATVIDGGNHYIQLSNDPMGWEMLHEGLHKHNRYFDSGEMNGVATSFLSVRRTRKMQAFDINVCCTDGFDPSEYITTSAGRIDVKKAITNYFSGKNNRVVTIESVI